MADSLSLRDCRDEVCSNRDDIPLKESGSDHSIDNEKTEYPPSLKLAPILIGLCFQSFCIALVSLSSMFPLISIDGSFTISNIDAFTLLGQYNTFNCCTQNHRAIQLHKRHILVCQCLPCDNMRRHSAVWQDIHLLFHEMDIHNRPSLV
jgi:hypothetical protein